MKLKVTTEVTVTNEYKNTNDIWDCIEDAIKEAVGEKLIDMLGNTSNITCNISTDRIRDNVRFVFNVTDKGTLNRMDALVERMQALNPKWNENTIRNTMEHVFTREFNMQLSMWENIIEEDERKKNR